MAGLGEACSHSAAIAFYLHVKNTNPLSCTDKLSVWPIPKQIHNVEFAKINNINWGKNISSYKGLIIYIF